MTVRGSLLILALAVGLGQAANAAVEPDEMFPDPALETRAQDLMAELRCVVCQSESILESNADIARDLRLLVRERIAAGDSDRDVIDFVTDRYGEFVLFRPPFTAANMPLWLAGPVFLIFGAALVAAFVRRRARDRATPPTGLTPEEQLRIDALMKD